MIDTEELHKLVIEILTEWGEMATDGIVDLVRDKYPELKAPFIKSHLTLMEGAYKQIEKVYVANMMGYKLKGV